MSTPTTSFANRRLIELSMREEDRLRRFHERRRSATECCLTTALRIAMIEVPILLNTVEPDHLPRLDDQRLHLAVPAKGNRSRCKDAQYHSFQRISTASMSDERRDAYAPIKICPDITMTHPLLTWAQMAAYLNGGELIVLADSLMRRNAVQYRYGIQDFADLLDALPQKFRRRETCEKALLYMRENTDSSMESRMRIKLINTKMPELQGLVVNHPVAISESKTVYLDMAIPKLRIGIEYSGRHHAEQWESDEERRTALTAINWRNFTANAETMNDETKWSTFVTQLRLAFLEQQRTDGQTAVSKDAVPRG
ncbi:hypothetical protein [Bifidobacterium lemurum]|nr:hypothetical protein [Bifidobacterium lemurum]QOL35241.1 hypothetical protein BL8807_05160 [Bifidobacterium lemurum]